MILHDVIKKYKKDLEELKLPIVLGTDEQGKVRFADLVRLQHILMAGSTGSGKSTFAHTTIATLLQILPKNSIQFFLVDMKRVELLGYKGLPQLFTNVMVDAEQVFSNLELLIKEKERRLRDSNNEYPYVVAIIDTFSDLMGYDSLRLEDIITRLIPNAAQAKIYVIMSDSRPSVDVFTTIIRKYFPTRICFNLSDANHALFILESNKYGAEKLRGAGDMLFLPKDLSKPIRIQAPYISEKEIDQLVKNKISENSESVVTCNAFIIHLFFKKYMLHIWTKPHKAIGWHRKPDGLRGRLLWLEKFN